MTKTYIKPETKTIKVELQQMIAESIPTGVSGNLEDAEGKGFSFFEEEEEMSEE